MRSVCLKNSEANEHLDQGLGILARIIARDIMRKQPINGDFKNEDNGENIQDK